MRVLEKAHRTQQNFKKIRLQVSIEIFPVFPFSEKTEFIFVLGADTKFTAPAPFLFLYGTDQ